MPSLPNGPGWPEAVSDRPLAFNTSQPNGKGPDVEVKIGVSDSPREIVFNSAQTPGEVEDLVQAALAGAGTSAVLALTDDKGKRILVQAGKISYVEIGAADVRRVGFGIAPGA
jgi:hypothetical protein